MFLFSSSSYLSKKALAFFCLSVASVVFFLPTLVFGAVPLSIVVDDISSSTSLFLIPDLPPSAPCTYSFGVGVYPDFPFPVGLGGTCNTNDWIIGDNSVRLNVFQDPLVSGNDYVGYITASSTDYYVEFHWDGSLVDFPVVVPTYSPIVSDVYETRFLGATLTASSTLSVDIDYFIDTSDFSSQYNRPDIVMVSVSNLDSTQIDLKKKLILPLTNGTSSVLIDLDVPLPDGAYTAQVNFYNLFSDTFVLNRSYLTINFTILSGALSSQSLVDSNNAIFPISAVDFECGLGNLSGCISTSFAFLFIPSENSVADFLSLNDTLATKFPFAYVYDFSDVISSLYSDPSMNMPTFSVPWPGGNTFTILSYDLVNGVPFVSLIRTIMGYLLWFAFGLAMYRRTLNIFNKEAV